MGIYSLRLRTVRWIPGACFRSAISSRPAPDGRPRSQRFGRFLTQANILRKRGSVFKYIAYGEGDRFEMFAPGVVSGNRERDWLMTRCVTVTQERLDIKPGPRPNLPARERSQSCQ